MAFRNKFFSSKNETFYTHDEVKEITDRAFTHDFHVHIYLSEAINNYSYQLHFVQNYVTNDGVQKNAFNYDCKYYTNDFPITTDKINEISNQLKDYMDFQMNHLHIRITTDKGVIVDINEQNQVAREYLFQSLVKLKENLVQEERSTFTKKM